MTTITALPPAPTVGVANFDSVASTFVAALPGFVTQANLVAGEINTSASNAATSASNAAIVQSTISATGAITAWSVATSYSVGTSVWESTAGAYYGLAYRKTSGGTSTGGSPPSANANWLLLQLPNVAGVLPIANGGTGTTSAAGARTNLGATATGDALFTTASATTARATLSAAVTGANNDITSMTALTSIPATATINSFTIGYKEIPQNSQSVAYTLVLADSGKHILHPATDTTARIFTVPANASVAFLIGTTINIINQNAAGIITITITSDIMRLADSGVTGNRTLNANGVCTLIKITTTEWIISGVVLS